MFISYSDLVGSGSFSEVYRGFFQGSEVAVKRLKVPLSSQDKNYFSAEVCQFSLFFVLFCVYCTPANICQRTVHVVIQVNLLRELRHPRVVLLVGICTTGRLPIMLLELMERGNLFDYLRDTNK